MDGGPATDGGRDRREAVLMRTDARTEPPSTGREIHSA
jgi:hypothetical protein